MARLLAAFIILITAFPCPAREAGTGSVRVSIIRTGSVRTLEKFVFSDGSWFRQLTLNHSAVLVDHPKGRILFDTGLGEGIDRQFHEDMPWWGRLVFSYTKGESALRQLRQAGERLPEAIILSHGHWDHGSGLPDFPGLPVWLEKREVDFLAGEHRGSVFKSQFSDLSRRLRPISLAARPVANYPESLDIFGDGRVVLVGMPGHTPGSVGLLVHTAAGKKLFFVGDVVWSVGALATGSPKFWLPSRIVDHDAAASREAVGQLRQFMAARPDVVVVPAHDGPVQDELGYFPKWID